MLFIRIPILLLKSTANTNTNTFVIILSGDNEDGQAYVKKKITNFRQSV